MPQSFLPDIEQCVNMLKAGNLILYPTDTIWGIGCDATNSEAVEKIYQLKKRSDKKTMIVLVAEENDVMKFAKFPGKALPDYLQHSIKSTTVIYEYSKGLSQNLVSEDGSIAIRICKDVFCRSLLQRFGKPIVSSSANISGQKPPTIFSEISDEIKNGVDYIVRYRQKTFTRLSLQP